jgi:8-oxo-dGTP pyrophosphatase MutT (NUDIX family)
MDNDFPVPAWLVEDARRFYDSGAAAATPRLASTVVLLRPAEPGFEVYAVRRVPTMEFAPSMYVFPGGRVDPRDAVTVPGWAGPAPRLWAARLALDEATARAVVCAAVREVFEESGVLLAGPDESTVVGDVSGEVWEAARSRLVAREIGFADLLADWGLVLRSDLLVPWARWVTPEFEPRRYDTYFFLARLPGRQLTRLVGGEADDHVWARPDELVASGYAMLPPTIVTLRELAAYPAVEDAIAAAGERDPATAVMPRLEFGPDGTHGSAGGHGAAGDAAATGPAARLRVPGRWPPSQ